MPKIVNIIGQRFERLLILKEHAERTPTLFFYHSNLYNENKR